MFSTIFCRCNMSLLCSFALLWITLSLFLQHTGAASDFILVPPNLQYVLKGKTARFVWTYSVDNRDAEFESLSPLWFFNSKYKIIGRDNGFIGWTFKIDSNTCPARLISPTVRVSRENQATLVIKDVITADNGIYGCTLDLRSPNRDRTNTTELIVTETPRFTAKPNTVTTVTEHSVLNLPCTAVGPPSPNITWSNPATKATIVQGIGSAALRILNVNKSQNGAQYKCQASNNPNERPVSTVTTVVVYYPSEITRAPINTTVNQGHDIILHCQATANPPSSISWKRENNVAIKSGLTQFGNGTLMIPNAVKSDAGLYICRAINVFNLKKHTATSSAYVIVRIPPGPPQVNVTNIEANTATIRWTKPLYSGSSPITSYKLTKSFQVFVFNEVENEYTVSGLSKDTQYVVRVYARNYAGYSKAASVYFKTKKKGPPALPVLTQAAIFSQTAVTLAWSKPEENGGAITGYTIYKKTDCESWTQVVQISGTPLTYTVKNLEPGKTYSFIVTATNEFGESVNDDSKATIILIPDVTTKLPDSGRTTASTMKQPVAMIAVGVCVCLLAISIIFNILFVVYFYRKRKKPKKTTEPTYQDIEMAAAAAPPPSYLNVGLASQPSAEYEPVRHTNTIPSTGNSTYEIPGNQRTSEDHYQQLNPETMQHDPTVQYEPLRTQHVTTDQRIDTYEPLRDRPTDYQSLQKYSNA